MLSTLTTKTVYMTKYLSYAFHLSLYWSVAGVCQNLDGNLWGGWTGFKKLVHFQYKSTHMHLLLGVCVETIDPQVSKQNLAFPSLSFLFPPPLFFWKQIQACKRGIGLQLNNVHLSHSAQFLWYFVDQLNDHLSYSIQGYRVARDGRVGYPFLGLMRPDRPTQALFQWLSSESLQTWAHFLSLCACPVEESLVLENVLCTWLQRLVQPFHKQLQFHFWPRINWLYHSFSQGWDVITSRLTQLSLQKLTANWSET